MALKKIDTPLASSLKEIRYLNKTFPQFRQSLMDFAKVYFPDTYNDFNEASPGMLFIEMASYVGDVLSYYIDTQFRENLMMYAQEEDNIIAMAQAFGYPVKPATPATCEVDLFQLCPARDISYEYEPDERYFLRIDANAVFRSTEFGNVSFRTIEIADFSDRRDRVITVYSVDANNKPLTYLVRKKVKVIAGEIKTTTVTFGSPQKFSVVELPDENVLEVFKITDNNGNRWRQVDYLAQDLIFDDGLVSSPYTGSDESLSPMYVLKLRREPRRFVMRYNEDFKCELHFGSGYLSDSSELISLEPRKVASSEYQGYLASTAVDPSDFLASNSYGMAPANVEMTVYYTVGGGIQSNVPSNSITEIDTIKILNDPSGFTPAERGLYNDIVASISVNNTDPATGGKGRDSIEEIRQNSLAYFNAQNRIVTHEDYVVRCYAMPARYGGVSKVFVAKDEQINQIVRTTNEQAPQGGEFVENPATPNLVNLYVLGFNQDKKIVTLNRDTKKNLKKYLDIYRILTDEIRILDGFVVNIGVKFKVIVYKPFNMNEVLARCIDAIKDFFDIDKWQMNQPIIINDLYLTIASVEGVQSVINVEIFNRYRFKDGSDYNDYIYDIPAATINGIIYPSLDPCLFELRYPEQDIIASAIQ